MMSYNAMLYCNVTLKSATANGTSSYSTMLYCITSCTVLFISFPTNLYRFIYIYIYYRYTHFLSFDPLEMMRSCPDPRGALGAERTCACRQSQRSIARRMLT